jgi:hypothetical protein
MPVLRLRGLALCYRKLIFLLDRVFGMGIVGGMGKVNNRKGKREGRWAHDGKAMAEGATRIPLTSILSPKGTGGEMGNS